MLFCVRAKLFIHFIVSYHWLPTVKTPPWNGEGSFKPRGFKKSVNEKELVGAMLLNSIKMIGPSLDSKASIYFTTFIHMSLLHVGLT